MRSIYGPICSFLSKSKVSKLYPPLRVLLYDKDVLHQQVISLLSIEFIVKILN
jgi:hypothetical protein